MGYIEGRTGYIEGHFINHVITLVFQVKKRMLALFIEIYVVHVSKNHVSHSWNFYLE